MNNLTPADYLRERFKQHSEIQQRKRASLRCPSAGLRQGKALAFRGAKIFNSLPKFIRDMESLSGFNTTSES